MTIWQVQAILPHETICVDAASWREVVTVRRRVAAASDDPFAQPFHQIMINLNATIEGSLTKIETVTLNETGTPRQLLTNVPNEYLVPFSTF